MREPRLTVVVQTGDQLRSLAAHLWQFSGQTEAQMGGEGYEWKFSHYDVPGSAEEEAAVRAAISAWAEEVGIDDVHVTIRLPSPIGQRAVTSGLVVWKCEDGPEDGPTEGSPDDVGPAWLYLYSGEQTLSREKLNGGGWMSRAEAEQLAKETGYGFSDEG